MAINERIHIYERALGDWKIQECLGQGGFGAVYKIVRNQMLLKEECALKVINLIEEQGNFEKLSLYRKNEYLTVRDNCSRNALAEVRMMYALRGHTNIVDYLDCKFEDWSDKHGFGRDLLIRMELLSDLNKLKKEGKTFTEKDILQIGVDICSALARCRKTDNFIHRDIKPGNIFVNHNGDYKLGDFGISKIVENIPGNMARTQTGTLAYMAPEQLSSNGYDSRVDIYSLGLVLYELGNQHRLPFCTSSYVNQMDVMRRLQGETLPTPSKVSPALASVILKACAYRPEHRYQTPEAFREALITVQKPAPSQYVKPEKSLPKPAPSAPKKTVASKPETFDIAQKNDIPYLRQMAEKGNPQAQTEFGKYHCRKGADFSYATAIHWFQKAAAQNYAPAQYELGSMYEFGLGVKESPKEAAVWYQKAAEQNHARAQESLSILYDLSAYSYVLDKAERQKWMKKAAENGEVVSQLNLGKEYKLSKNYTEAIKWIQKSANANFSPAIIELGDCYYNGIGVKQNYGEAVRLYKKAAEYKNTCTYQAQKKIGDCYKYGHGVAQSQVLAEYWYEQSKQSEQNRFNRK